MTPSAHSLSLRQFSAAATGPRLLITGGVHGDEFEPMQSIRRLIRRLENGVTTLSTGQLILIPCVNEAAFFRGHRMAEDLLDLARVCPGDPSGSITERTAAALSAEIRQADYYIDLHTGGTEFSVHPLTGYTLHSDENILAKQRKMALAFNLPIVWGTSANLNGRSLSVARDAGVPAIYAEYLGGARCAEDGVRAYEDGCLNVLASLGMISQTPPASQINLVVEDPREGSGHMQICHPSPIDGYFHSVASLGDEIKCGAAFGYVTNFCGDERHDVHAEHNGRVLTLRTFPRVLRGESVGVILDT